MKEWVWGVEGNDFQVFARVDQRTIRPKTNESPIWDALNLSRLGATQG